MNRTAKGWLTDARSHINTAIEMLEKQTELNQGYLILSHISDARLAVNKAASALPGVPDGIFPPDPDPEGLAQIAKLESAEHVEWIVQQSINLPNVHIGLLQGHKAVITDIGIGNAVWQVEVGTFIATFDSLDRAKESAEIVLRDRAKRRTDPDQFQWNDTVDEGFGKVSKSEFVADGQYASVRLQSDGTYKVWVNASNVGGALYLDAAQDIAIEYINRNISNPPHANPHITDPTRVPSINPPNPDDDMVAGLGRNTPDPVPQLSADYQALKDAGNAMAAASFRVATEYDGCHRLMLAVSDWARAVANESGRGNAS